MSGTGDSTGYMPNEPPEDFDRPLVRDEPGGTGALLADLFDGFASQRIDTRGAKIFLRTGGDGPPLLLLHGFPQTHVIWHRMAPTLAEHFTLVIPDLRGYGWSSMPRSGRDHRGYSKRTMAEDMIDVMAALGHPRFAVAGHDRGGRVGYRMALDHPDRLERLAVLDIVPTWAMWHHLSAKLAMKAYHWLMLAQPAPLPESLIGAAPLPFLEYALANWTKQRDLSAFDERALDHYRAAFADPKRIHAFCEDYRAGRTADLLDDEASRAAGQRMACPVLALWGESGLPHEAGAPLDLWHDWCAGPLEGGTVDAGHFLPEENPRATAQALLAFLRG